MSTPVALAEPPQTGAAAGPSAEDVSALAAKRARTLIQLRTIFVLALAVPALAFMLMAGYLHSQQFADARAGLDRAAHIAQEHALKLFDTNEMLLHRMLDLVGSDADAALLARGPELHDRLKLMVAGLPQVQGLYVNGADGRMLASSRVYPPARGIDFTDREWFKAHRGGAAEVFVTEQLVSRSTGEVFFDMSRRRSFADGSFGGVVNVSLRPAYLTDFYQELATTMPGLRMAVLRRDGKLLARWPGQMMPGQSLPADDPLVRQLASGQAAGVHEGRSTFDGVERLRAFRALGTYPLGVVASVDRSEVSTAWLRRCLLLALFTFPTAAGLAWMAWRALRSSQEAWAASERLEAEAARRQRAELALLQSQKLEAMGRLTGGVAHDFNNLLMVISSNLFVHRRKLPEAAESAHLAAIERAVGSGTKLTRQLLAFARKQALIPERIVIQDRLPALIDLIRPLLGSAVHLHQAADPRTDAIEVDAAELELALINLAVNARDAMQGRGELWISARNAEATRLPAGLSGPFVVIEVLDDGPGIDPAIADRVFEPFFTTKPIGQGTGLGLSQVHALCRSAGGTATIAAALPTGTRVSLYFRAASAPASAASAAPDAPPSLRCRVLLAEDNEAVAQSTRQLLEAMECEVEHVRDAQAALGRLAASPGDIDIVLSDIEMPGGIDGIALGEAIRQRFARIPIVLMTGYAIRLEEAAREGFEVLPKPCSPTILGEAIARALARRAASA